jgi:D-alanyl-D-alanine carboxypeptidase/D-alanyl-D-alanine-endopeptidase (penicillin-binding protein 4)
LLRYIHRTPAQKLVLDALPVAGGATGSLRSRLQDLQGRVIAKTGSISHVDALAGYLTTDSGRRLAFVVIANQSGQPSSAMRPVIDDIVRVLAADGSR